MSDVEHTYVDTNNGLGGPALGAGFGGLIYGRLGREFIPSVCSLLTCLENIQA